MYQVASLEVTTAVVIPVGGAHVVISLCACCGLDLVVEEDSGTDGREGPFIKQIRQREGVSLATFCFVFELRMLRWAGHCVGCQWVLLFVSSVELSLA